MEEENLSQNKKRDGIVRTYESDISDAVKLKGASISSIAMAEQERKDKSGVEEEKKTSKEKLLRLLNKKNLTIAGLILIFVVATVLIVFVVAKTKKDTTTKILPATEEIIFSNKTRNINVDGLDREGFIKKFLEEKNVDSQLGSITNLPLTTTGTSTEFGILGANQFMDLIGARLPYSLSRTLETKFMFGLHYVKYTEPFLILKISSFENAFEGMLGWEKNIENDLNIIFMTNQNKNISNTTDMDVITGATTSEEYINPKKTFGDMVVKNKDTRILKDKNGNIILMYSFPDRKTIVITTNQYTMAEIFDRLNRVKFDQ